ncbi:putative formin-like protein 7-like [Capsicum annuum]|nr:putative formin-like protein 7-like [Capsicum annuum]
MMPFYQTSCSSNGSKAEQESQSFSLGAHHQCIATLKGQNSYTSSLVLAGKFLFTGSSDKEICMWEQKALTSTIDASIIDTVIAGKGAVKSLVILADKVFSAHQDHKIRVWRIENHHSDTPNIVHLATLPILSDRAFKFMMPKNHVQIRRHKKSTWVHHVDTVSALALSNDESFLYSVSWDRTLKIWRTTDFKCLESIANAHDDAINALEISVDGDVFTGSADKKIKIWRKGFEEKKHSLGCTLEKHKSGVNALAVGGSSTHPVLYSGACDRSILVWEKDEGGDMLLVGALRGHKKSILCLAVVADLVCSGSEDKTVRVWRGVERCYSCLSVIQGHTGPVKCLTVTSDQQIPSDSTYSYVLYSASLDGETKVWKVFVPFL